MQTFGNSKNKEFVPLLLFPCEQEHIFLEHIYMDNLFILYYHNDLTEPPNLSISFLL